MRQRAFKGIVQTIVYVPHFISWVLLSVIFLDVFSVDGVVNSIITAMGRDPVVFLTSNKWFPVILIGTEVLKEFGYSAIIFLAALTSINPELYEVAAVSYTHLDVYKRQAVGPAPDKTARPRPAPHGGQSVPSEPRHSNNSRWT